jgi:histone deacetylase complex regulatory component SIN3
MCSAQANVLLAVTANVVSSESDPRHPSAESSAELRRSGVNDALSFLDQVKVAFRDEPLVYDHFLFVLKDLKDGSIDTPGLIESVLYLFSDQPKLITDFNAFLPLGYTLDVGEENHIRSVRCTTPMGTTVSMLPTNREARKAQQDFTAALSEQTESEIQSSMPTPDIRPPQRHAKRRHRGGSAPELSSRIPSSASMTKRTRYS